MARRGGTGVGRVRADPVHDRARRVRDSRDDGRHRQLTAVGRLQRIPLEDVHRNSRPRAAGEKFARRTGNIRRGTQEFSVPRHQTDMGDDHRPRGRGFAVLIALALTLALVPGAAASKREAVGAQSIVDALNEARTADGLSALADSPALDAAARAHAVSMARRGYFAHESADGTPFWRRIAGFYPAGGFAHWQVGETLYWSRPGPT